MQFIVVEDRKNTPLRCCVDAARRAGEPLLVLDRTESPDFDIFATCYEHKSPNSREFELMCFRRYFLLNDHCRQNPQVRDFVLIDSDVMLYRGASRHVESRIVDRPFVACAVEFSSAVGGPYLSPHFSYWHRDAIADFCSFLLDRYRDTAFRRSLDGMVADLAASKGLGGISDMTLLTLWSNRNPANEHLNCPSTFGTVDHNLNMRFNGFGIEYRSWFWLKRVAFEAHRPVFVGRGIRHAAVAIHFQGFAKALMPYALDSGTGRFLVVSTWFCMKDSLRRAKLRFKAKLQALGLWDRNR